MFRILIAVILLLSQMPIFAYAKCTSGGTYYLKGYFEDANNTPVTGKSLSEVRFYIYYDDGTSATGNNSGSVISSSATTERVTTSLFLFIFRLRLLPGLVCMIFVISSH